MIGNIILKYVPSMGAFFLVPVLAGCSLILDRAEFNPNQTGIASCQFISGAHPQVVAHDRNPYGESVRTRTGQTQLMTECLERLDAIADAAEDKADADETE